VGASPAGSTLKITTIVAIFSLYLGTARVRVVAAKVYCYNLVMLREYFGRNMNKARYEMIDGGKRFYGEIRGLKGIWATGKTLEECRRNLSGILDGWMVLRLKKFVVYFELKITTQFDSIKI
jgi:hypothetical protein